MDKELRIVSANENTSDPISQEEIVNRARDWARRFDRAPWKSAEDRLDAVREDSAGGVLAGICGAIGVTGLILTGLYWMYK